MSINPIKPLFRVDRHVQGQSNEKKQTNVLSPLYCMIRIPGGKVFLLSFSFFQIDHPVDDC